MKSKILLSLLICPIVLGACGGNDSSPVNNTSVRGAQTQFEPAPDSDAFYTAPAAIPDIPGTILSSRAITFQPAGVPLPNPAWQIQYATRDVQGRPIAAVATVVKPMGPSIAGQPVLVSFQHAYDSLGAQCTPSQTAQGSTNNQTNLAETLEFLPSLQAFGWTMVIPDYEGPRHAWGANRLQGQATLDAVRAALQFEPLGLNQQTPVGLWGYSGGAWATTWAAALQPQYAKELNLVGSVAGGTPVEFLKLMKNKEGTDQFSFLFSAIMGMAREYPEILTPSTLTEKGLQVTQQLKDACVGIPKDGSSIAAAKLTDYVKGEDPYTSPAFVNVSKAVTLLDQDIFPTTDIYMYHEVNDELVLIEGADKLVKRWCEKGVPLTYYRNNIPAQLNNPAIGIHLAGAAVGTPASVAYLQSRLAGLPASLTPPGAVRCN
ncbi:MAG: lipase family protein [Limnobacter sp.]|nr:lipase family protein [Limnobacter sp.]